MPPFAAPIGGIDDKDPRRPGVDSAGIDVHRGGLGEDKTGRRIGREEDGMNVKGGGLDRIRGERLPAGVGDAHVSPGGSKA